MIKTPLFRTAFLAMLASLGVTVVIAVSSPRTARDRLLAIQGGPGSARQSASHRAGTTRRSGQLPASRGDSSPAPAQPVHLTRQVESGNRSSATPMMRAIRSTRVPESTSVLPEAAVRARSQSTVAGRDDVSVRKQNPLSPIVNTPPVTEQAVTFRTQSPLERDPDSSSRLEARLVGLERQLDRLAQAESTTAGFELKQAAELMRQLQQGMQLQGLENQMKQMQELMQKQGAATDTANMEPVEQASPNTDGQPATKNPGDQVLKVEPSRLGGERFSLQIQDAQISHVMDMLGQLSGENILLGNSVEGLVTANLQDVTIEEALTAILRSRGYVYRRDGRFIFVMTAQEATVQERLARKLITKIYRPNYISVADLQTLITPLLTEGVSRIAVTSPPEVGIASDGATAGGDALTQRDALLVQDYAEVIEEVDAVLQEMDVPPMQVVIEAMIFSVRLDDSLDLGVNFALLGGNSKSLTVTGNGQTLNNASGFPGESDTILPPAGQFIADAAGLKFGFIQGDVSGFIQALETISDTNLIAAPQLRVLNKHKAELIIGDRISYRTLAFNGTQTVENVQFLDSGTKLLFRPFISPDGIVRMEVHPERSSAVIDQQTGLPNQATTEVTTNVMVRDGTTVVIGGLIEEQVVESYERVPFLGAMPLVGRAFRNKSESIVRSELIVLITPRIVREPAAVAEGDTATFENAERHESFRDDLAIINRRNLARIHFDRALMYYEKCDFDKALHHIEQSLLQNKNSLDALRLRDDILAALDERRENWIRPPWMPEPEPPPEEVGEVVPDQFDEFLPATPLPPAPGQFEP